MGRSFVIVSCAALEAGYTRNPSMLYSLLLRLKRLN